MDNRGNSKNYIKHLPDEAVLVQFLECSAAGDDFVPLSFYFLLGAQPSWFSENMEPTCMSVILPSSSFLSFVPSSCWQLPPRGSDNQSWPLCDCNWQGCLTLALSASMEWIVATSNHHVNCPGDHEVSSGSLKVSALYLKET